MTGLSPTLSKVLAATLLVVLLMLVWSLVALPIATSLDGRQGAIELGAERIARYGAVAERADALRAWSESGGTGAPERLLYAADTPALATANLQRDLDNIARRHGITLRNAQGAPESDEGDLVQIGVRASFSTSYRALMPFLADLGAGGKLVKVTQLDIAAPIRQADGRETELRVDLQITAFMRGSPAS